MKKKKKEKHFSNKMVIASSSAVIGYFIVECIFQYLTGTELSPAVTAGWFGYWGAEIVVLARIKNNKIKYGSAQPPESEDIDDQDIFE